MHVDSVTSTLCLIGNQVSAEGHDDSAIQKEHSLSRKLNLGVSAHMDEAVAKVRCRDVGGIPVLGNAVVYAPRSRCKPKNWKRVWVSRS